MRRRYKKTDIDRHSDDGYGAMYPAVNVKTYRMPCTTEDVIAKFPTCSDAQAEKALEFAYDSECRDFWEYWGDLSGAYFPGETYRVSSTGRSGGWLIVQGLPPVEEWNAVMVNRWAKFEKDVLADVEYRMSKEVMLEGIEANQWYLPYSDRYNFADTDKGVVCLATVKADVAEYSKAKFGIVPEFA